MKKVIVFMLMLSALAVFSADLVVNGRPVGVVYMESLPPLRELPPLTKYEKMNMAEQQTCLLGAALLDLNYHLRKMSGAELPLLSDSNKPAKDQTAIIINVTGGEGEKFRLKVSGNRILIEAESPAGAAYGIYELLQRLGCDWVMPGVIGEVIPVRKNITLEDMDIHSAPDFAVRCPWYSGTVTAHTSRERAEYDQWKLRHKLQLVRDWHPLVMKGGHVSDVLLRLYAKDFEADPEMLALIRRPDGSLKRQKPQLETTNPKVLAIYEDYIRKMFAKNHWPKDHTVCIGVGPADGGSFSESTESSLAGSGRTDPMTGKPDFTDLQILLCNQLLEKLSPEFPNLHLGFYLYSTHADFPARYQPHPKVLIVIADISYSRMHSTLEPASKTRTYYKQVLEKWSQLENPKFFRGYNWNLAENFLPYSKLKMWGDDLPFYHKIGVKGVYNETNKNWASLAPGNYLEAVLLWDVSRQWPEVLNKYCRAAFGKGGPFLEQYYTMLTERQSRGGMEAGSYHSFPLIYDLGFIDQARSLFIAAAENAELAEERKRIEIARAPLELLAQFLQFRNAVNEFDFQAGGKLFTEIKDSLKELLKPGDSLVSVGAIKLMDRFWGDFVKDSQHYSSGKYRIAYRIPDRLKTMFDPYNQGGVMGYANPELNDRNYIRTATISSTWDAQGLMGYRFGSAWYRLEIPTPAEKEVGLLIGGADAIVSVYCNGQYVGMGKGFAKPFAFDLTGLLKPDGKNLLAIQVQRFGNSEVGTGGLIYPSFIFTGPRLKQRAPMNEEKERLLPGGAVEKIK